MKTMQFKYCQRRIQTKNFKSWTVDIYRIYVHTSLYVFSTVQCNEGGFSEIKPLAKGSITFDPHVGLVILTINQI